VCYRAAGAPSPQPSPRWGEGVLLRRRIRRSTRDVDAAAHMRQPCPEWGEGVLLVVRLMFPAEAAVLYGSTDSVMVAS